MCECWQVREQGIGGTGSCENGENERDYDQSLRGGCSEHLRSGPEGV